MRPALPASCESSAAEGSTKRINVSLVDGDLAKEFRLGNLACDVRFRFVKDVSRCQSKCRRRNYRWRRMVRLLNCDNCCRARPPGASVPSPAV